MAISIDKNHFRNFKLYSFRGILIEKHLNNENDAKLLLIVALLWLRSIVHYANFGFASSFWWWFANFLFKFYRTCSLSVSFLNFLSNSTLFLIIKQMEQVEREIKCAYQVILLCKNSLTLDHNLPPLIARMKSINFYVSERHFYVVMMRREFMFLHLFLLRWWDAFAV